MSLLSSLGAVTPPSGSLLEQYQGQSGLIYILNQVISLLYIVSGLFVFINFILAGYQYLAAKDDQAKIKAAGDRILYSLIGLLLVVASFVIAAVLGYVLFKDASTLIRPTFWRVNVQ